MEQNDILKELADILYAAQDEGGLPVLLAGLMTPQEIEEILMRWRLMCLLQDEHKQRDIARELGISLGKIARGSRLLKYGPPEFRQLLQRLRDRKARPDSAC